MLSESMNPVLQNFLITVITGILGVLGTFLIALAKKGIDWLKEKIDSLQDKKMKEALNDALNNLYRLVEVTVESLAQTVGDEIKKSIEANDGRYTKEDLYALKDKALESVTAQLTIAQKEILGSIYEDLNAFIADLIEQTYRKMKNGIPMTHELVAVSGVC